VSITQPRTHRAVVAPGLSPAADTMLVMPPTKREVDAHARAQERAAGYLGGSAPKLLLAAAQDLCAERGPYATTAQIAERAGVSEDLIFRYYG